MTLMSSSTQRKNTNRTRPALEGLEDRKLLSGASVGLPMPADASGGTLSSDLRNFTYTTPTGGQATIEVVGVGNLEGTTAPNGVLNLVFGGTNAYTKIVGVVQGGGGHAPLQSIQNNQLISAGASNSLSGVGGNVVESFLLSPFDLVAGGRINLTAGVNSLALDSIGPDTQVNLRALPPAPTTTTTLATSSLVVGTTATGTSSVTIFRAFATTTSSSSSNAGSTLQALQSTTVTSPYGVSTTYLTNGNAAQTLTAVSGEFKSAGNIVEPLPTGQPIQTVPPAPPGIILKVNRINGNLKAPINPQKDAKIFGYDATTGQVVRFSLDLDKKSAKPDSFPTIQVPNAVLNQPAGLDLAWDGQQRVLLVSAGSTIYAYNPVTAASLGQFTTAGSFIASMNMVPSVPITMIAGTDTLTVLGTGTQLYAIDLPSSLSTGIAQPATGNPDPFSPLMQFAFLGGLTSSPGTNTVFATIAGHFDTTQPSMTQLGIQAVSTASVMTVKGAGSVLSNALSPLANTGVQLQGAFVDVPPPPPAYSPGAALGSIDQTLALVTSFTPPTGTMSGTNTVSTENDTYTFNYSDPLEGLSQTFRPDLYGSALIDIQGTVQSIRGGTATGMVLNDTGNLNLVKFRSVKNSTIIGQPVSHIQIQQRSKANVLILTKTRAVGSRNDVTLEKHLRVIGPLSQPNDVPFPPAT
jgi:hypothetical protein